jgi:hypothetical protein
MATVIERTSPVGKRITYFGKEYQLYGRERLFKRVDLAEKFARNIEKISPSFVSIVIRLKSGDKKIGYLVYYHDLMG